MIGVREPIEGVVYPRPDLLARYVEAGELPLSTIAEKLWESFERHADRTALTTAEGDIDYRTLDGVTDRLAGALVDLGLRPLDRVMFQSANSKELTYSLIACFKAGLIPVCTLSAHREREIGYIGAHTEARAIIVQDDDPRFDFVDFAGSMRGQIDTLEHVISMRGRARDGALRIEDLIEGRDAGRDRQILKGIPRDPYQVAIFQLSGGTTGVPKVIPRMHADYLLNGLRTAEVLGYRTDDVMFMPMQIIHNAAMICFWLPSLLIGATFTIPANLTPEAWAERVRHMLPTFVGLIRPLLPRFEAVVDLVPQVLDRVRAFWSPDSSRALRHRYGKPSYAMFGMSEGMNMYVRPGDGDEAQDWTVGWPISPFDEVRLLRPGTRELAEIGEVGELTCRGPYTLAGYYKAPERNAEAFDEDGFYHSGDLLQTRLIDGQVYYSFAGRSKDVVDRGAEKINCEEVEHAMLTHASILGCAVVGMPDEVLGERVCAFVIPRNGHAVPEVPQIQQHMSGLGMAKFKWPERIEAIDALPLTKAGKLDKAALRAIIAEKLVNDTATAGA